MSQPPPEDAPAPDSGPIALDALAYGIDLLDGILVFHLGDAHIHASWVRPDTGLRADDMVPSLRDAYRVCQFAARRIAHQPGGHERRGEAVNPVVTVEIALRTALLRRIRSYIVATLFDAEMPLGMARLVASRAAAALEPELPLGGEAGGSTTDLAVPARVRVRDVLPPPPPGSTLRMPEPGSLDDLSESAPATLSFGAARPRRTQHPPPRATPTELDRTRRLLTYFDAHAPEPHVARHRLALRAGLTLVALSHPEALGPEAIVVIETAVQDLLGLDRAELREALVTPFGRLVRELEPQGLSSLGDQLVAYQCHHHSLFLDQTVTDALGGEGWAVRRQAAFESSHALLASFCAEFGIVDAEDRLGIAADLFAGMGHGRLEFDLTAEGGTARGHDLHFGASFREKYGAMIRNRRPVDSFAAGFISAAASLAFPSDWGTLEAEETACVGRRDAACLFSLTRRPERPRFGVAVNRQLVEELPFESSGLRLSPAALRASSALARLLPSALTTAGADEPPRDAHLAHPFGARVALLPVGYTNQITFDTVHLVEKRTPELFPIVATLLREAAQTGAFHLLGGVLASRAFRDEHGAPAEDVEVRLEQLLGLTRALGWGAFYVEELIAGQTLILTSPMTHESAYYATRHGPTVRGRLFFQEGVALAIMQLLTRVDFADADPIGAGTYDALFTSGARFHVEETKSPLRGDRVCEVAVEALAER